jgi:hypothetical protein
MREEATDEVVQLAQRDKAPEENPEGGSGVK